MTRRRGLRSPVLLLAAIALVGGGAAARGGEARVSAVQRRDVVHLRDGTRITGAILMSGPRAVVLATDVGESLETVVPREEIERIERGEPLPASAAEDAASPDAAEPDADADDVERITPDPPEADAVRHYRAEPQAGSLVLVEITDGGGGVVRDARPDAPRGPVDPDGWDLVPEEAEARLDPPEKEPTGRERPRRRGLPPVFRPSGFDEEEPEDKAKVSRRELFGQDEVDEASDADADGGW